MKAIIFNVPGEPVECKTVDKPTLKENQVYVNIKAASVNHRDVWMTKGLYPKLTKDTIMGSCGAGIYEGREVIVNPNINWGDNPAYPNQETYDILGMPHNGTFGEYLATTKDRLEDKPAHLSWEEAAALPLAGLTAYRALFTKARVTSSDKVLISGVGGGVALMACQFAIAIGADVYVTSSSEEKTEKAISLGAKGGANYKDENWLSTFGKSFGGVDVVIDSAGGKRFGDLMKVCNPQARIATYGGTRGKCVYSPQILFFKELELYGTTMGNDQEFKDMVALVNKHKIKPVVDSVYDLSEGQAAFEKMDQGKQFGKIVFKV